MKNSLELMLKYLKESKQKTQGRKSCFPWMFHAKISEPYRGLCALIFLLHINGDVSDSECLELKNYLKTHLPDSCNGYSWPKGEKEPRIVWLQKQIAKL